MCVEPMSLVGVWLFDRVSLCSSGWHGSYFVDQVGLELTDSSCFSSAGMKGSRHLTLQRNQHHMGNVGLTFKQIGEGKEFFWQVLCAGSFSVNCTQLESFGKREPQLRKCSRHIGLWASLWYSVLIDEWCGRAHLTVAGGPGCYKKAG